jgi:hypothetical protein
MIVSFSLFYVSFSSLSGLFDVPSISDVVWPEHAGGLVSGYLDRELSGPVQYLRTTGMEQDCECFNQLNTPFALGPAQASPHP